MKAETAPWQTEGARLSQMVKVVSLSLASPLPSFQSPACHREKLAVTPRTISHQTRPYCLRASSELAIYQLVHSLSSSPYTSEVTSGTAGPPSSLQLRRASTTRRRASLKQGRSIPKTNKTPSKFAALPLPKFVILTDMTGLQPAVSYPAPEARRQHIQPDDGYNRWQCQARQTNEGD